MPLTNIEVKNAKPKAKPYKLSDGGGLFLLVQPTGSKWWRYKYRYAGKEKLLALGVYPEVSLADARDRHLEARRFLSEGNDPNEVKKEAKRLIILNTENSFEAVAREWHENRSHMWSPRHTSQIMKCLEADVFPKIGRRPIADITAPDLLAIARVIEARGATNIAHRAIQYSGQVFAYAIVTGKATRNPTLDLRGALKPLNKKHNPYLKADELPEFLEKLQNYDGHIQTRLALKMLIYTFVRTIELRGAEWTEINFDKAEWRIPAERMKMRDPHIVHLSTQMISLLKEMKKYTGQWKYVFPNQFNPSKIMSENTVLYALYRLGYHSRTTGHGFRACATTILYEHSFSKDAVERQLAHAERNTTRASYDHAQHLPERRKMMQWWSDYLDGLKEKSCQI